MDSSSTLLGEATYKELEYKFNATNSSISRIINRLGDTVPRLCIGGNQKRPKEGRRYIESNLGESHSKFADTAPALAERLIHLELSPDVRPYAAIQAISECFKILQQGIIDKNNREKSTK